MHRSLPSERAFINLMEYSMDKTIDISLYLEKRAHIAYKKGELDAAILLMYQAAERASTREDQDRMDKQAQEWLVLAST